MVKKSVLTAKRCAKEAQKPTALEALLQNLAKAQEEAIAPQRKKARATKKEQPHSADAEAAAELETEQEEIDKMRDTDEGSGAAISPTRLAQSRPTEEPSLSQKSSRILTAPVALSTCQSF